MSGRKHTTHITDFLESTGVLSNGTAKDIADTKKNYWKEYRKAWRKQQRKECTSCTIYFSETEVRILNTIFSKQQKNLAGFVKQATLNAANNKTNIDKELVGKIREAFFIAYEELKEAPNNVKSVFLELEGTVINLMT